MSDPERISRLARRRRRRERIAGAALAVLGVAVLVVAIMAVQQQHDRGATAGRRLPASTKSSTHPTSSATRTATTSTPPASPTSSAAITKLPLVVLNNTTTQGLAQSAAQRFEAGGWTVTTYSNYQNDIISTCAYYDPGVAGAQDAALALQQQFPTIKRVQPQFSGLATWHSPIVVILTPDYSP